MKRRSAWLSLLTSGTRKRPYDELLMMGHDRWEARDIVTDKVDRILAQWETPTSTGL